MKPDDRDIIEQDYTPLSNAELVAHIERYAGLMHSTPLSDGEWLDDIIGPARVLLARAEAAEALAAERLEDALFAEQRATDAELERDGAILAASDAERHAENAMHGLAHFRARVAELESQLAAQQWRPVTEAPPAPDAYLVYRAAPPPYSGIQNWMDATQQDIVDAIKQARARAEGGNQ